MQVCTAVGRHLLARRKLYGGGGPRKGPVESQASCPKPLLSATAVAPPPPPRKQRPEPVSAINVGQPDLSQSCATVRPWAIGSAAADCRGRRPVRDAGAGQMAAGAGRGEEAERSSGWESSGAATPPDPGIANDDCSPRLPPSSPPERCRRSVISEESKWVGPAHQADFAATAAAGQRHGDRRPGRVRRLALLEGHADRHGDRDPRPRPGRRRPLAREPAGAFATRSLRPCPGTLRPRLKSPRAHLGLRQGQ